MTVHDTARLLPAVPELRDHCRALAMLEAILSPPWENRYYSFDAHWSDTEEMASMSNGCGDEYAIVFSPNGAYVRGFAHESRMSPYADDAPWPGVLDDVPAAFRPCVDEPAFCDEDGMPVVTACLWREPADTAWRTGTAIEFPDSPDGDPDGAALLFPLLTDRGADAYRAFAEDYYDVPVAPDAVRHVLALRPLTSAVVSALNPDLGIAELTDDITSIGYPRASGEPAP
ncbi:hypothetical protein SAMN05216251_108138 [Actinacidiphila alni]|uniref:Uncharacterized protein n=1 Tax=Actinacidiphila alni TaxID=380248 RepID=A0A1I2FXB8_9ACTN|nr:hypothetical protein [Actinacidiphila alni]SFF10015.1 hypothetical protein SAMN05216251_108138 [Actinacidiphila alni]